MLKKVVILGSGGTMGALTGGVIASSGLPVYFLSRDLKQANAGMLRAINQAHSEIIQNNILTGDYENDLESSLKDADWVVECITEKLELKNKMYDLVEQYRKPDSIVSSMTSSYPISVLCEGRSENFRQHFLGIHLYNPPAKLIACEIASHPETLPDVLEYMKSFLARKLHRIVVPVYPTAAYAGNHIAFLVMNKIVSLAEKYGVEIMDYLIGPYTGRIMPPLRTIDLVGLDIYKAIIQNLYKYTDDHMHESFHIPSYLDRMIEKGCLGNKFPQMGGFYKRNDSQQRYDVIDPLTLNYLPRKQIKIPFVETAKQFIHIGRYQEAFDAIRKDKSKEAAVVNEILCTYVAYAFSCIGVVTDEQYGINGIDKVMANGFNWAPPSLVLRLMGSTDSIMEKMGLYDINIPDQLVNYNAGFESLANEGKFFSAA